MMLIDDLTEPGKATHTYREYRFTRDPIFRAAVDISEAQIEDEFPQPFSIYAELTAELAKCPPHVIDAFRANREWQRWQWIEHQRRPLEHYIEQNFSHDGPTRMEFFAMPGFLKRCTTFCLYVYAVDYRVEL
jgi:hypothetical protein